MNDLHVVILVLILALFVALLTKSKNTLLNDSQVSNLVSLVNVERTRLGLRPLTENTRLNGVAIEFALQMNRFQFHSHVSPTGKGPLERVRDGGVSFSAVGENLAWGPPTDQEAVREWMQSDAHRRILLDPRWRQTGVGVIEGKILKWGDRPVKYYVQLFIF